MEPVDQQPTTDQAELTSPYGRAGFVPPTPEQLAQRITNLDVIELLGQGGMGVVYKGRQPLLDRYVAIKVVRPDCQTDSTFQQRFLREARTLAMLRHPYIVTVYDVGKVDDLYYLVMEYVEGLSLRHLLSERKITERDALDFVPQVAQALKHAHEAGVVHRDVKPENLLIDAHGRVRLVDFGLATIFGKTSARDPDDSRVAGTLGYMAPEQLTMPESVDHRADIYSTGVVFYEMLAGELPHASPLPPSKKAATDPRLDPIVLKALERERDRRYQDAHDLHSDIIAVARTPETTLRLEQRVDAPPDAVFNACIDTAFMPEWYAPFDTFKPSQVEVDSQVGGRYRVTMFPPDRDPVIVSGHYCRVDHPRTLSFTWLWETPHEPPQETQVTIDFHAHGTSTDVVLTQERFRDVASKDSHNRGWTGCLERLARKIRK